MTDKKTSALGVGEPIISVSGLRGIVGTEFTPQVAVSYTAAFCGALGEGPVLLARDGRTSGRMLCDAIASAIQASGRECRDLDVAATPTVGVAVGAMGAAGAIQVSASHNPPAYNGMKLFGGDGRVLPARVGLKVLERYRQIQQDAAVAGWVGVDGVGQRHRVVDPHQAHLDRVLATVDVEGIRSKGLRVLVDSNHGAGSILAGRLLESLGCTYQIL